MSGSNIELSKKPRPAGACSLLDNPHVKSPEEVCAHYHVDPLIGLSPDLVQCYRENFGSNTLEHEEHKSIWALFLEQFQDLLARILLAAAFLSFLLAFFSGGAEEGLTAFVEPFVILLILVANAAVSVWQENRAEKSLESLKHLQPELARVLRSGQWQSIPTCDVVPGDVCQLRVGDRVPADLRLLSIKTVTFRVEQSQLTGEARAVIKDVAAMDGQFRECEIQAKNNMLFFSTTVVNGSAIGIAVSTGMNTEIGKIQSAVQEAGADEGPTPLQAKLDEFGELLSKVIGAICVLVWVINFRVSVKRLKCEKNPLFFCFRFFVIVLVFASNRLCALIVLFQKEIADVPSERNSCYYHCYECHNHHQLRFSFFFASPTRGKRFR